MRRWDGKPTQTGACGKTSLLCSFALGEFPKEYVSLFALSFCFILHSTTSCLLVLGVVLSDVADRALLLSSSLPFGSRPFPSIGVFGSFLGSDMRCTRYGTLPVTSRPRHFSISPPRHFDTSSSLNLGTSARSPHRPTRPPSGSSR